MALETIKYFSYISENLKIVRESISESAASYSRDSNNITLVGVSKMHPPEAAAAAVIAGLNDLGENRTEELSEKFSLLAAEGLKPNWHMIGTLQRRKVRQISGMTCLIHSVDSMKLLREISSRSLISGLISEVLLEMNVSGEESKHGFAPYQISEMIQTVNTGIEGVIIRGLMTMAPYTDDGSVIENVFDKTNQIFSKISSEVHSGDFNILSMGMSNDYQLAIKHGATHLRIGTAIFGKR